MAHSFAALSLDVGGVLVVPDHGILAAALEQAGVPHDRDAFGAAHYEAMAAVDAAASRAEDFTDYLPAFALAAGVAAAEVGRAVEALGLVFGPRLWVQPVPGARTALARLAAAGTRLAVTSNSDGGVADLLYRHEWCQVGEGPGVAVEVVTDSGHVGVAKPDPRLFQATAEALGLDPADVLHVGDSAHYDVAGALAAGMQAVHVDPLRRCPAPDHAHVRGLADLVP